MKRIAGIFAAVFLAVVVLFALFIVLLPREMLKTQIGRQIAGWTGREVSLRGEPEIDIFPKLSVTLNDVQVSGPPEMTDAEIVSMDRLTGTIRLLPLIIGRVEIDSFTMEHPLVRLVRDEQGHRNWAFDAGAAALQLAFAGDVPLGVFHVEGGTLVYEDRATGETERFDSVDLTVEWTSVRTSLAVEGTGIWRGEQVTVSAGAEAPFAFLNGAATPFEARVESAPISMIFTGEAADYPDPQFSGALKLSSSSLRRFANWLGSPIGPGSTLGQASLFGTAEFDDGNLSVSDAEFTLDGNDASGALMIKTGPTPDIAGTLAFDALDLTPYFTGLSTALSVASDWRTVELPTDWFRNMSADIRLSANSTKLGALSAGSSAASVTLRDARLEIGIARAEVDRGSLSGDLAITHGDQPKAEAQVRLTDMDVESIASALGLSEAISGTGSAVVDVTTAGGNLGALVDDLNGTARFDLRQGRMPAFGIASVAAQSGVAAVPAPINNLSPVPVEAVSAGFSFSGGVAILERSRLTTSSYAADVQGWIGLRDGTLGLNGEVRAKTAAADTAAASGNASDEPQGFPFTIGGALADPVAEVQEQTN
jgi:AsmA protein